MPKPLMCPLELLQLDLSGKTYIITGGASGIGLVTACQLAKQGATVVIGCRDLEKGARAVESVSNNRSGARLEVRELDLARLASVRSFAERFLSEHSRLDGLVNNAGVMKAPRGRTADGFETQFGTNHLGHFLLTQLLVDVLQRSAPSRVVNVSSAYHDVAMGKRGDIHFDDVHYDRRPYDGWEAYAQSKLANVLHARELASRLAGTGVTAVSLHPGWVRTKLMRHVMPNWLQDTLMKPILRAIGMLEPWEGAQTTLYTLLAPEVVEQAGEYFSQVGFYRDKSANKGGWPMRSPNPNARDDLKARRLWELSAKLTSVSPD